MGEWPAPVDRTSVDSATDLAFAGGAEDRVRATVIVQGGKIVYERYSPNTADGPDVVMPSFSVAKSVTSAFIGILVRDGLLNIDDPAPVPEWHEDPSDPRAQITVEHMLHMATGIPWTDDFTAPGSRTTWSISQSRSLSAQGRAQAFLELRAQIAVDDADELLDGRHDTETSDEPWAGLSDPALSSGRRRQARHGRAPSPAFGAKGRCRARGVEPHALAPLCDGC